MGYSLFPYLEQTALFQLGADGQPDKITPEQKNGAAICIQTPVSVFVCPSRRGVKTYPMNLRHTDCNIDTDPERLVGKSDYAGNYGTLATEPVGTLIVPEDFDECVRKTQNRTWGSGSETGVIFQRSTVSIAEIRDGTTNTYLLGEKNVDASRYESGDGVGDNESICDGTDNDSIRSCYYRNDSDNRRPIQDREGANLGQMFGSCHSGAFGMAMGDGSVQRISYELEPRIHAWLSHRSDGNVAQVPL